MGLLRAEELSGSFGSTKQYILWIDGCILRVCVAGNLPLTSESVASYFVSNRQINLSIIAIKLDVGPEVVPISEWRTLHEVYMKTR